MWLEWAILDWVSFITIEITKRVSNMRKRKDLNISFLQTCGDGKYELSLESVQFDYNNTSTDDQTIRI